MFDLEGKTALVTGASQNIGRGIAVGLAEAGVDVAVNYPPIDGQREKAAETAELVRDAGQEALPVEADVSDVEDVRSMIDTIHEEWGTIDVLVNNAGTSKRCRVAEMPVDLWDHIVAVNLRGTFLPIRFALPRMLDDDGGVIVNIASQTGIEGSAELVHYSAAKGGVIALTRALAREVSPTVRVNAVAPGPIRTGKREHGTQDWWEQRTDTVPMDRPGEIDDIVPTVLFLASPMSDYYTGHVLNPDGGETMH